MDRVCYADRYGVTTNDGWKGAKWMTRARSIVEQAARITRNSYSKQWLTRDERGTWEALASKHIDDTAAKAASLGMTADAVDREIANMIALTCVTAQLRSRQGG